MKTYIKNLGTLFFTLALTGLIACGGSDDTPADVNVSDEAVTLDEGSASDEGVDPVEDTATGLDTTGLCSAAFPCQPDWIGDGSCDAPCNCEAHDFDGGDCDPAQPEDVTSSDEGEPTDEGVETDEGAVSDEGTVSDEGVPTDTGVEPQEELELIGTWENNFGGMDIITAEAWDLGSYTDTIVSYDNDANSMITMTPDTVAWNDTDTYNMVLWTEITQDASGHDMFYYCTAVYGAASADDAANAEAVYDNSSENPDEWTCGSFGSPWTKTVRYVEKPEIVGTWENNFGGMDIITVETWNFGSYTDSIVSFDNDANSMITMTPDTVEWNETDTYNMILWTDITQGEGGDMFYYCNAVYGAASAEEAMNAVPDYDNSAENPNDWTCGSFGSPWTLAIRLSDAL